MKNTMYDKILDLYNKIDIISNDVRENNIIMEEICDNIYESNESEDEDIIGDYLKSLYMIREEVENQLKQLSAIKKTNISKKSSLGICREYNDKLFKKILRNYIVKKPARDAKIEKIYNDMFMYQIIKISSDISKKKSNSSWMKYFYLSIFAEKKMRYHNSIMKKYIDSKDKNLQKYKCEINNDSFQNDVARSVYLRRQKYGITQNDLANKCGVNRTVITKVEKIRQNCSLATAINLLGALDMGILVYPLREKEQIE